MQRNKYGTPGGGTPGSPGGSSVNITVSGESDKSIIVIILIVIALFIVVVMAVLGFAAFVVVFDLKGYLSVHRYCMILLGDNVYETNHVSLNGIGKGFVEVDIGAHTFSYSLCFQELDAPTSLVLKQTSTADSLFIGTQVIPTSGAGMLQVDSNNCLNGYYQITEAQAKLIVDYSVYYYVFVTTADFPLGALAGSLTGECREH